MSDRLLIAAAVASAVLVAAAASPGYRRLVAGGAAAEGEGSGEQLAGAVAVTVRRETREFTVPAIGYLDAVKASPVAVPRVPTGALKVRDLAPEGSIVEPGQVVIVFDDTQLNIELDNHKASFRSAERRVDRTAVQAAIESGSIEVMREVAELTRDHATTFKLEDDTIFSKLEILDTEVQQETAEETILFADASLLLRGQFYDIEKRILGVEKGEVKGRIDRVHSSLGNLVLKAPIGGLIIYRKNWRGASVGVGDTLWPGNVVMSIVDPTSTVLTAYVLEKDAAGVQAGAAATVRVDARPDRLFKGTVTSVAEVAGPIERGSPVKYCEVKVSIEDGDPALLKPGMKGEAAIVIGRADDSIVVPRSAVRGRNEEHFVMVETAAAVERRPVSLGPGDLVTVSVLEGLGEGDRIFVGGAASERAPAGPNGAPESRAASRPPSGT
ncbi:MAG TPA: HlyD family efflux transporter periplasmic adaptor subunit [Candidatus Polarisedimenticolia bacterium]|nr:HlyD family efflux transporter periplasmic adaptor subunit [Candidatus Polarisedimenticolia bacterium]